MTVECQHSTTLSKYILIGILFCMFRFIFCQAVLYCFCPPEDSDEYLPVCLPPLPTSLSPHSEAVQSSVIRLAKHLKVANCFHFSDT